MGAPGSPVDAIVAAGIGFGIDLYRSTLLPLAISFYFRIYCFVFQGTYRNFTNLVIKQMTLHASKISKKNQLSFQNKNGRRRPFWQNAEYAERDKTCLVLRELVTR